MRQRKKMAWIAGVGLLLVATGCGGDARIQLAAADSMDVLRSGMAQSLSEYHADLAAMDEARRQAVVEALIDRLRADTGDDFAANAHAEAFRQAMQRLDADREVSWQRYAASMDTLALMGEIASDLRRVAAESMSLNDDAKRYFTDLVQQYQQRRVQVAAEKAASTGTADESRIGKARLLAETLMGSKTR